MAVELVWLYELIPDVKILVLVILNSPDLLKKTYWLKSYRIKKSKSALILQFPFESPFLVKDRF